MLCIVFVMFVSFFVSKVNLLSVWSCLVVAFSWFRCGCSLRGHPEDPEKRRKSSEKYMPMVITLKILEIQIAKTSATRNPKKSPLKLSHHLLLTNQPLGSPNENKHLKKTSVGRPEIQQTTFKKYIEPPRKST